MLGAPSRGFSKNLMTPSYLKSLWELIPKISRTFQHLCHIFYKLFSNLSETAKNHYFLKYQYFLRTPSNFFIIFPEFPQNFQKLFRQFSEMSLKLRRTFSKNFLQFRKIFQKITRNFYQNVQKIYSKSYFLFLRNSFLIFLKIFKYFCKFFPSVTHVFSTFTFLQNFSQLF